MATKRLFLWLLVALSFLDCNSFAPVYRARKTTQRYVENTDVDASLVEQLSGPVPADKKLLMHWKGDINEGYSFHFRHVEFEGALSAVSSGEEHSLNYENALVYNGDVFMTPQLLVLFEESMQFVTGAGDNVKHIIDAVERCSLAHAAYDVIAIEDTYAACAESAIQNGGFDDLFSDGPNKDQTWCVRVRHYGDLAVDDKVTRHSERARSMKEERKALVDLTPLLLKFGGKVDLTNPDSNICLFNGLKGKIVLARQIAKSRSVSAIRPPTRICVTNTPLCPIAAYSLCNIAGVRNGFTVLDPYAGSCTTLLAAAMIAPECKTVGIEIAPDWVVNRTDVMSDFSTRNLTAPLALLNGDSTNTTTREEARQMIGGKAFDLIITDPPYGIRESANYNELDPLSELFASIADDREAGTPLLRKGGKLVAFVPCTDEEQIDDCLPTKAQLQMAGLEILDKKEQPLNEKLSRWLVSFECTK